MPEETKLPVDARLPTSAVLLASTSSVPHTTPDAPKDPPSGVHAAGPWRSCCRGGALHVNLTGKPAGSGRQRCGVVVGAGLAAAPASACGRVRGRLPLLPLLPPPAPPLAAVLADRRARGMEPLPDDASARAVDRSRAFLAWAKPGLGAALAPPPLGATGGHLHHRGARAKAELRTPAVRVCPMLAEKWLELEWLQIDLGGWAQMRTLLSARSSWDKRTDVERGRTRDGHAPRHQHMVGVAKCEARGNDNTAHQEVHGHAVTGSRHTRSRDGPWLRRLEATDPNARANRPTLLLSPALPCSLAPM